MDATRTRRQKDSARQRWYARFRQWRLARHMGFLAPAVAPPVGRAIRIAGCAFPSVLFSRVAAGLHSRTASVPLSLS